MEEDEPVVGGAPKSPGGSQSQLAGSQSQGQKVRGGWHGLGCA